MRSPRSVVSCAVAMSSFRAARMNRFRNFPFCLDGDEPLVAGQAHRDVFYPALNFPTLAVAQPAQFGQENPALGFIQMNLFGIRVAEAVAASPFPETRQCRPARKEVCPGPFQILERLLESLGRSFRQPEGFRGVTPRGEQFAQYRIARLFLAALMRPLLQGERLVEDHPAASGKAAHESLLETIGAQLIFPCLQSFHGGKGVSGFFGFCQGFSYLCRRRPGKRQVGSRSTSPP